VDPSSKRLKWAKYFTFVIFVDPLDQACTTYGPRAKFGPRKLFIWPAKTTI
jgi:hypothetical protein